jgi:hypothetical protein
MPEGVKPISLMCLPTAIYFLCGLIYDNATNWQATCGSNLYCDSGFVAFNGQSVLGLLLDFLTGKWQQLFQNLFGAITNPTTLWALFQTYISIGVGTAMIILGIGLGFGIQIVATGFEITGANEQGSKLFQCIGLGMLLWGITEAALGGWETVFDTGFKWPGLGIVFNVGMETIVIIGAIWLSQTRN